jgi:hypothetical protein
MFDYRTPCPLALSALHRRPSSGTARGAAAATYDEIQRRIIVCRYYSLLAIALLTRGFGNTPTAPEDSADGGRVATLTKFGI